MKFILTLFFATLLVNTSFSKCSSLGIWALSTDKSEITENPVIIIIGYANSQETVSKLAKEFPVYLRSKNHLVSMEIVEIHKSKMTLTQALLSTTQKLHIGEKYTLIIDDRSSEDLKEKSSSFPNKYNLPTWTVKKSNALKPSIIKTPELINSTIHYYGCGPAQYINLDITTNLPAAYFVKTIITNKKNNEKQTFYVTAINGKLSVGHNMCSGAFIFNKGIDYEIECSILNENWKRSEPIRTCVNYNPKSNN